VHRIERVNSLIRQEISDLLQRHVKDPRLDGFVAVNAVDTAADLSYARVFVSRICNPEEKEATLKALKSASGFMRRQMGRKLRLRQVPELDFQWDDSIERGEHLLQIIDDIEKQRS
jgi:ribosome-binding factor A